jgi:hypothetical protein
VRDGPCLTGDYGAVWWPQRPWRDRPSWAKAGCTNKVDVNAAIFASHMSSWPPPSSRHAGRWQWARRASISHYLGVPLLRAGDVNGLYEMMGREAEATPGT